MFSKQSRTRLATLIALMILGGGATANALNCSLVLLEIAERGLDKNSSCENCNENLLSALRTGPEQMALMANWISRDNISFQELLEIHSKAGQHGIEILNDLSSQNSYKHASWDRSGVLATFVFKGNKSQLIEFFQSLGGLRIALVHFEVLNFSRQKTMTEFLLIHSGSKEERAQKVAKGLSDAKNNLVLINDVDSKAFLALIDEGTFQEFLFHSKSTRHAIAIDLSDLLTRWNDEVQRVRFSQGVFLVRDHLGNTAYLTTLDELSEIQIYRAKHREINDQLIQRLGLSQEPEVSANTAAAQGTGKSEDLKLEAEKTLHEPKLLPAIPINPSPRIDEIFAQEIISVPTSESVLHRGAFFGPTGSARMGPERPAVLLTFRGKPKFVQFYPAWIRIAPLEEVYATFMHAAGLRFDQGMPADLAHSILEYRSSQSAFSPVGFASYSLSDVTGKTMGRIYQTDQPMVFRSLNTDNSENPLSFVLLPIKFSEKSEDLKDTTVAKGSVQVSGAVGSTIIDSFPISDFIQRRGVLFEPRGQYELGKARPAVQLKRRQRPAYVLVHPEWMKTASLDDIIATYKKFAEIDSGLGVPEIILTFIDVYRQFPISAIEQKYPTYSLSQLNSVRGGMILNATKQTPIVFTSLEQSRNKSIEYVLLPILNSDPPRPQQDPHSPGAEHVKITPTSKGQETPVATNQQPVMASQRTKPIVTTLLPFSGQSERVKIIPMSRPADAVTAAVKQTKPAPLYSAEKNEETFFLIS